MRRVRPDGRDAPRCISTDYCLLTTVYFFRVALGAGGGGERASALLARGVLLGVALPVLGPEAADFQPVLDQFAAHVEVAPHLDGSPPLLHQAAQAGVGDERRRAHGVRGLLV